MAHPRDAEEEGGHEAVQVGGKRDGRECAESHEGGVHLLFIGSP